MESQSNSTSSSSSTLTNTNQKQPHFQAPLRSVRKVPAKPWKKTAVPLPPAPPGIYNVEPKDFKDLVQKLTKGPAGFQPRRLERVAPPPLSLSRAAVSDSGRRTATTALPPPYGDTAVVPLEGVVVSSPLVFSPSPTSRAWSSFFLPSPGTMSSWEQGTML